NLHTSRSMDEPLSFKTPAEAAILSRKDSGRSSPPFHERRIQAISVMQFLNIPCLSRNCFLIEKATAAGGACPLSMLSQGGGYFPGTNSSTSKVASAYMLRLAHIHM